MQIVSKFLKIYFWKNQTKFSSTDQLLFEIIFFSADSYALITCSKTPFKKSSKSTNYVQIFHRLEFPTCEQIPKKSPAIVMLQNQASMSLITLTVNIIVSWTIMMNNKSNEDNYKILKKLWFKSFRKETFRLWRKLKSIEPLEAT